MTTINIKTPMRDAIAMIELIFAIVIIGITLLSAPLLISQASKSGYVALQQESIAAAASQMGLVLTRAWDEADENQTQSAILMTSYADAGNAVLRTFTVATPRPGMDGNASRRHTYLADNTIINASTTLGSDGNDTDDIDDFDGNNYTLSIYLDGTAFTEATTTEVGDYIDKNISIATTVEYGNDVPRNTDGTASANAYNATTITFSNPFYNTGTGNVGASTTNIKLITVRLTTNTGATTPELQKDISLSAFSTNIGSYIPTSRTYP